MKFPKKSAFNVAISRNNTLSRSLIYIQGFDNFINFSGTSICKGKNYMKTFTLYICNTKAICKIQRNEQAEIRRE